MFKYKIEIKIYRRDVFKKWTFVQGSTFISNTIEIIGDVTKFIAHRLFFLEEGIF